MSSSIAAFSRIVRRYLHGNPLQNLRHVEEVIMNFLDAIVGRVPCYFSTHPILHRNHVTSGSAQRE